MRIADLLPPKEPREGPTMPALVRPIIIRYLDAAGRRVPKGTPGTKRVKERARKWYGTGLPGLPRWKRVPLASDKRVALQKLNELCNKLERRQGNLPDLEQLKRPILDHLADFRDHLESKPDRPGRVQISQKIGRCRRIIEWCEFTVPAEI